MRPAPTNPTPRPGATRPRPRRGSTAVLAMLFLILFSTLAIGFFASTSTAVQIAGNEHRNLQAQLAAESGMEFMKYQMATLEVPASATPETLFTLVYDRLRAKLEGYPNMTGRQITMSADGNYIFVPGSGDGHITTDSNGSRFHAVLEKMQNGRKVLVKVVGQFGHSEHARALQLEYAIAENASRIFNYGVASKSPISMNGNVSITGAAGQDELGSVLSATMSTPVGLVMTGSPEISGAVSFVRADASPDISSNAKIAGLKQNQPGFWDNVKKNVPPPEFPHVDTTDFAAFVPGPFAPPGPQVVTATSTVGTTLTNVRIKANANRSFAGGTILKGVIYVETPNQLSFSGGVTIQGVIVVQTDGDSNKTLSPANNTIDFTGGVNFTGVETLPATTQFPPELRALTGSMLLAPGFDVRFGGNFNTVNGSIIASKLRFHGTAGGTVRGSVINLNDTALEMSGTSDIVIESRGTTNYPAGVFFGSHYTPLRDTYAEVAP